MEYKKIIRSANMIQFTTRKNVVVNYIFDKYLCYFQIQSIYLKNDSIRKFEGEHIEIFSADPYNRRIKRGIENLWYFFRKRTVKKYNMKNKNVIHF